MTDDAVTERLTLLREAFLRSAPCQPKRLQADIDFARRELERIAGERPDCLRPIKELLSTLERECVAEGLRFDEVVHA